jgi:steroid delta-isomerase-like uncharacterized protein
MHNYSEKKMRSVRLIQEYFRFIHASEWVLASELLADQVLHDINQGPRVIGREPFYKYLVEMSRYYEEQVSELQILVSDDGLRGSVEYYITGRYKKTHGTLPRANGQSYEGYHGVFFEVEGSLISRFSHYFNFQSFLEQIS